MGDFFRLVGPDYAAELFGVRLIGVNAENGAKLLVSLVFVITVVLVSKGLQWRVSRHGSGHAERASFWTRQGIRLVAAVVLALGLFSIWFDQPARLATAFGMMSAGLAFALQRVITVLAGYFIILRGDGLFIAIAF